MIDTTSEFERLSVKFFFLGSPADPLGNPIVDWCPRQPCPFEPGPAHKHSLILDSDRRQYMLQSDAVYKRFCSER